MHALHLDWPSDHSAGTLVPDVGRQKRIDVESIMQTCGLCWAQFPVVKYPEHLSVCSALRSKQLRFAFAEHM